eukprot:365289-Chlamydomonas_euryale.AAC.23
MQNGLPPAGSVSLHPSVMSIAAGRKFRCSFTLFHTLSHSFTQRLQGTCLSVPESDKEPGIFHACRDKAGPGACGRARRLHQRGALCCKALMRPAPPHKSVSYKKMVDSTGARQRLQLFQLIEI